MATRAEMLDLAEQAGFRYRDHADLERWWRSQQPDPEWLAEFNERTEMVERLKRQWRQEDEAYVRELQEARRRDALARARHKLRLCRPLARRPRSNGERPRARRNRRRPSSTAPPDPADEPRPEGVRPPRWVVLLAEQVGIAPEKVRFCSACRSIAFSVDGYQTQALDEAGWVGDLCPRHARGW
jgi:hypothetical protein